MFKIVTFYLIWDDDEEQKIINHFLCVYEANKVIIFQWRRNVYMIDTRIEIDRQASQPLYLDQLSFSCAFYNFWYTRINNFVWNVKQHNLQERWIQRLFMQKLALIVNNYINQLINNSFFVPFVSLFHTKILYLFIYFVFLNGKKQVER